MDEEFHDNAMLLMFSHLFIIAMPTTIHYFTSPVSVRWRLHFEFMTLTTIPKERPDHDEELSWNAPSHLDVEAMVWDLPIKVYATNPSFINKVSVLNHEAATIL